MAGGVLLRPFFNTLLWNHNGFDTSATFSEDCGKTPERVIPRSLHNAWWLVMIFYVFPMAVAIGISDGDQIEWHSGYIATLASESMGLWLGNWLVMASGISNVALYQSQMSGAVFKLMGMAHIGLLPKFLGLRSPQGTPTYSIILSSLVIGALSLIHLHKLIEIQNFNYGIALLLEYAAFIKLRISQPNVPRPYKVPFGTIGCILVFIPPVLLISTVLLLASTHTMMVGLLTICIANLTWLCFAKQIHESRDNPETDEESPMKIFSNRT